LNGGSRPTFMKLITAVSRKARKVAKKTLEKTSRLGAFDVWFMKTQI